MQHYTIFLNVNMHNFKNNQENHEPGHNNPHAHPSHTKLLKFYGY